MWFQSVDNVCVSDDADPVPRLTGFAKATKTSGAAKVYWRRLNSKRTEPSCVGVDSSILKDSKKFVDISTTIYTGQEQSLYLSLRMRGAG